MGPRRENVQVVVEETKTCTFKKVGRVLPSQSLEWLEEHTAEIGSFNMFFIVTNDIFWAASVGYTPYKNWGLK